MVSCRVFSVTAAPPENHATRSHKSTLWLGGFAARGTVIYITVGRSIPATDVSSFTGSIANDGVSAWDCLVKLVQSHDRPCSVA
jgi:hypothetical protein